MKIKFEDLGLIDYKKAWDYQADIFGKLVEAKKQKQNGSQFLLFCEHPHVYTLGKNGDDSNMLMTEVFLKSIDATFYRIDRGGDITYHGPGQIVGYPIFDLDIQGLSIKEYIYKVEQSVINTLNHYGIVAGRLDGATGVWLNDEKGERKICAIGVKASRKCTMHGFAFNVNTDIKYFDYINPCGFTDKGVTSLENEIGEKHNFEEVKLILKEKIYNEFGLSD